MVCCQRQLRLSGPRSPTTSDNLRFPGDETDYPLAHALQKAFATKRRTIMTDFTWEMGIDWNAMQPVRGLSYLRTGLASEGVLTKPSMNKDDTITFVVFDVTDGASAPQVKAIEAFVITTAPAVPASATAGIPFSSLQPQFSGSPDITVAKSTAFTNPLRSWTSLPMPAQVTVTVPKGRFLLTFLTEAVGEDNSSRTFAHDPEMIIGEHG